MVLGVVAVVVRQPGKKICTDEWWVWPLGAVQMMVLPGSCSNYAGPEGLEKVVFAAEAFQVDGWWAGEGRAVWSMRRIRYWSQPGIGRSCLDPTKAQLGRRPVVRLNADRWMAHVQGGPHLAAHENEPRLAVPSCHGR